MSTIEFIEKEPYELNTLWFKEKYFPCYMLKDGIELFVWNRSEPSDRFDNEDLELRKQQLISNGGAYFKFFDHSSHISPLDFLSWVSEHKLTLHEDTNAELLSDGKTFDFLGNLNECSCAFFYRIFDRNIMKEVLKKVSVYIKQEHALIRNSSNVCMTCFYLKKKRCFVQHGLSLPVNYVLNTIHRLARAFMSRCWMMPKARKRSITF